MDSFDDIQHFVGWAIGLRLAYLKRRMQKEIAPVSIIRLTYALEKLPMEHGDIVETWSFHGSENLYCWSSGLWRYVVF
jgi:hypothetical protein